MGRFPGRTRKNLVRRLAGKARCKTRPGISLERAAGWTHDVTMPQSSNTRHLPAGRSTRHRRAFRRSAPPSSSSSCNRQPSAFRRGGFVRKKVNDTVRFAGFPKQQRADFATRPRSFHVPVFVGMIAGKGREDQGTCTAMAVIGRRLSIRPRVCKRPVARSTLTSLALPRLLRSNSTA